MPRPERRGTACKSRESSHQDSGSQLQPAAQVSNWPLRPRESSCHSKPPPQVSACAGGRQTSFISKIACDSREHRARAAQRSGEPITDR